MLLLPQEFKALKAIPLFVFVSFHVLYIFPLALYQVQTSPRMLSQTALLSSLLEHAVFPLSTKVLPRLYVCLLLWVLSVFVVVRRGSID